MYTDGSVNYDPGTAASALLIPTEMYRLSGRLTEAVSSMTEELCALREALRRLFQFGL